ncbi:MAG: hypothetical protein IPK52_15575 [Chloroflexi bacterium]|nr:hypothetical protein [Chloroflexota bacterium]
MSAATFAAHDQLVTAAYSAAITLIAAIVDPVALENAPLRHRATALNAVSALIGRLHKSKPSPLEGVTHIEWDFGEDEDDGSPLVTPYNQMQPEPSPATRPGAICTCTTYPGPARRCRTRAPGGRLPPPGHRRPPQQHSAARTAPPKPTPCASRSGSAQSAIPKRLSPASSSTTRSASIPPSCSPSKAPPTTAAARPSSTRVIPTARRTSSPTRYLS